MKALAIIGTAGRGEDEAKLGPLQWGTMIEVARTHLRSLGPEPVVMVSGGAAWADHVAVMLALENPQEWPLSLHLPGYSGDVETARKYHHRFSRRLGINSLFLLDEVERRGRALVIRQGMFKDRNRRVADEATEFLAMTFGHEGRVKDGGTAHTVRAMQAEGKRGWHLDLNTLKLHPAEILPV